MKAIQFKLLDGAVLPSKGSVGAAGYDIKSLHDVVLQAGERMLVKTGVVLADCPDNVYLRVAPRSKLANKFGVATMAGVVDSDYRGEIGVILLNTSGHAVWLEEGSAVAQLIPEMIANYPVVEATETTESERGAKGIHCEDIRL